MTIEAYGDRYLKDDQGYWFRLSQDGSLTGRCHMREVRLLEEIVRLMRLLEGDNLG